MKDDLEADFAAFYRARFGSLTAQLYALTGDFGEAQEAAQEAFVRAWPRWRSIRDYESPAAWLYLVGSRVAVNRWRSGMRAIRARTRLGAPPSSPPPDDNTLTLVAALRELPDAQRRAVVLHHMVGRSVAEIAHDEGVAVGTVKARLSRGRAALAQVLSEIGELEEESNA